MEMQDKKELTIQALNTILDRLGDHVPFRPLKRPRGLEKHFDELCSILKPCLVDQSTNVATFLVGSRGSGKSRLIENCLQSFETQKVRIVRINGLVLKGEDVGVVVREIIRQLSDIAFAETKRGEDDKKYDVLLRLRTTSFSSCLSFLDEILTFAHVDKVPICILLKDFDAMLGSSPSLETQVMAEGTSTSNRQLLLYHLLDRVASRRSCLCVIGTTTNVRALGLLEKRVKSRAEGASHIFYIKAFHSLQDLLTILRDQVETDDCEYAFSKPLQDILSTVATADDGIIRIRRVLERNYKEGKDLRWFNRVLYFALSLYRQHIRSVKEQTNILDSIQYALVEQGASFESIDNQAVNARIALLRDLAGPQVALLLSARRILARDAQREETPKPLNLQRILQEYQSYRGTSDRFQQRILRATFFELLEMDVLRPSCDHSGGAPFQYEYACPYYEIDSKTLLQLPLHLPLELDQELTEALKRNMLHCSTSLKDWGMKMN